jgi:ribosome modulation factor
MDIIGLNNHSKEWDEGYEAYFYEDEIVDCPYSDLEPNLRSDWIKGWLSACEANEDIIWMEQPLHKGD